MVRVTIFFTHEILITLSVGLQNMTSKSEVILDLVDALATAVNRSPAKLTSQAVGNSLYGKKCNFGLDDDTFISDLCY
jgi:hypothetical protein